MSDQAQTTLLASARNYWRSFAAAWVFPLVFLFGGLLSEELGHPLVFFWLIAAPFFFWSFFRAFRAPVNYWHMAFWGFLVPFIIWAAAVYTRLLVLNLVAGDHAV